MGAGSSSSDDASGSATHSTGGSYGTAGGSIPKVQATMEDLKMPPRRDRHPDAASQQGASIDQFFSQTGGASAASSRSGGSPSVTEEIFRGGEPLGQIAFQEDGLVGTESQQLSLLAHYAEQCEDFRRYQRQIRAEGPPLAAAEDGAQLLLLSGPPGTGKTQHALSFARALGLPLLMASPAAAATTTGRTSGWSVQLRKEVNGRDCVVFFDEIDQHAGDDAFASELRQFLDGVCQPSGSRVLLVGTTNRIDRLPQDVRHRAEVINFEYPLKTHLAKMWSSYAQHLKSHELSELSAASEEGGITGRDVRHCASWVERRMAMQFMNENGALGYCHGFALMNCPAPPLEQYMQCVQARSAHGVGLPSFGKLWRSLF